MIQTVKIDALTDRRIVETIDWDGVCIDREVQHPVAWTTHGSVRGGCGHRHRTREAAERCRAKDRRACAGLRGGACSDRRVVPLYADD